MVTDAPMRASRARGVVAAAAMFLALFELTCWLVRAPGVIDGALTAIPRFFGVAMVASADTGWPIIAMATLVVSLFSGGAAEMARQSLASMRWVSVRLAWLLPRLRLIQRVAIGLLAVSLITLARSSAVGIDPAESAVLRCVLELGIALNLVVLRLVLFNLPAVSDAFARRSARSVRASDSLASKESSRPSASTTQPGDVRA